MHGRVFVSRRRLVEFVQVGARGADGQLLSFAQMDAEIARLERDGVLRLGRLPGGALVVREVRDGRQ